MSGRGTSDSTFDIYIYQVGGPGGNSGRRTGSPSGRPAHASRSATRKQRDRAAVRLKRKAAEFLAQAGELRKVVARLSTPENLVSQTVFAYFQSLIPRLNSVYQISNRIREGFRESRFPSGAAGFEFLLRVVKNLIRQIEAALAVSELESNRCRRRPAYFDLYRLLEQASRGGQNHYLAGEVGFTANPPKSPLQIRGKRSLWYLVVVDLICRAEELSPRKGIAVRVKPNGHDSVTLTLVPRGALFSAEESRAREHRQKFLGRTRPDQDPAFVVTQTIIDVLQGRLTVGRQCRSYITPLFTLEIPVAPERDGEE
jgi:hypothetical protein